MSTPHTALDMAVQGPNQKHAEDIANTISVKIDDHGHFKPNIQLLSNKNSSSTPAVFSILSNQPTQAQTQSSQTFDSQIIFTDVRQNESLTNGLRAENTAISFNPLPGTSQDNPAVSDADVSASYDTTQLAQPPQIFSASINGANLLSTTAGDQTQLVTGTHATADHLVQSGNDAEQKVIDVSASASNQAYTHSINLGNNLHIGLPTMTGTSSDPSPQQSVQPAATTQQVTSNIQYIQATTAAGQYSHASSGIQYVQSTGYQASGGGLVTIDAHQPAGSHQPTYVLLQAPGDSESGAPPQVFLAMQTTSLSGQDAGGQPYITLQPVSVDGTDLGGNTMVQEGVSMQQTVLAGGAICADGKTLGSEGGQQVVLSIPGQQALMPSSSNNGQPSLVTYLQPLGSIGVPVSNMEQGQVIMAASDLQGNLTLHNVPAMGQGNKRNILASSRQTTQVGLTTPRRRLSQDPRSCVQCGRCFKYPSDLKKHLQIHTDIKKFACEDCPRTFRRLHQLNVHRRIHTGEKPYVCNRCGAQFRHDSTLTMHIRTRHDHLKPFTCDGCSKKFGRMSHLRKHQRNVCGRSGLRGAIAQCKYCDATFTKKVDLKGHFNVCEKKPDRVDKDGLNPSQYPCETCGKEFSRVYDFKRHQLSHSDEKPYGCPQCGKTFKERSSLNKHVKRMHCSDGDGTIPIDDDGICGGDDDDEEEMSGDEHDHHTSLSCLTDGSHHHTITQVATSDVSAEALAQAGIITSRHEVMTAHGQTISATEILNFPEVAEALGINSGAHATVLDSDGHSTMIAITQPGNLETTEVSMDMEQNMIQDGGIILTENHDDNTEHYITAGDTLQMNPVQVVADGMGDPTREHIHVVYSEDNTEGIIYNTAGFHSDSLDSTMVFKQEDDGATEQHYMKREEDLADHVKAEQAAAHDLQPEEDSASDIVNRIMQEKEK